MPHSTKLNLLAAAIILSSSTAALANEQELETVKVTSAAGFEQNIADAPASISVISGDELNKKSYTNVLDAVKNIPGVYMTGGGGMGDISIRGMSAAYTMYLVDGRPVSQGRSVNTNGTDGGKQIGLPPVSMIERIEVIRGPMSSLYGSDAMGGIINIITKKTTGEWSGNINTEWTHSLNSINNDEQKVDLMTGGALVEGKLGMQVTGSWIGTDESDYGTVDNKSGASTPEGKNKEIGTKLIFTPDENNDISVGYTKAVRDYRHTVGKSLTELNNQGRPNSNMHTHYEKDIYTLTHDGRYDNILLWSYIQHDISENIPDTLDGEKKESLTIANTQGTAFIGSHALTFGAQYRYEKLIDDSNGFKEADATSSLDRWIAAVFTELEWNITQDLSVTTGLRYNYDENFGSHLSPRIYSNYHLTDSFTIKGGISTGYKQPSLTSVTDGFARGTGGGGSINKDSEGNSISRALIVGNPDLTPETSTSYEIGYVYDRSDLGLNTSLMLFYTEYKDKIVENRFCTSEDLVNKITDKSGNLIPDNNDIDNYACKLSDNPRTPNAVNPNTYYYLSDQQNIDKANMQGLELTASYLLTDNLKINSSYTYTESEQKTGQFKGQALNKMPKHMANASLDWEANDKLTTWAQYNYRGEASEYLSRTSMANKTPAYGFIDVGLNYQLNERANAKFGLYNLANKAVTNADYEVVLDGRRVNLGLSVDF